MVKTCEMKMESSSVQHADHLSKSGASSNLPCFLRRHSSSTDSSLQRQPAAQPHLHLGVSFHRTVSLLNNPCMWKCSFNVEETQWPAGLFFMSHVINLTRCVQVHRGLEAPHCGEVDHRFGYGNKSIQHHSMSQSKQRNDLSSVRSNEVEVWSGSYPNLIAPQEDTQTL